MEKMRRLMLGGTLPSREQLLEDDLIIQMLGESKEEGKAEGLKEAEKIVASLTVEDIEKMLQARRGNNSLLRQMAVEKTTLGI